MQRATHEEWAARLVRWKESGLTATAFARELGVNPKTLTWWRKRLAAAASSAAPRRMLAPKRHEATGDASTLARPLNFVEMTAAIGAEPLEVVLGSSVRINVRPGFDSPTLARLLDVLESRR